MVYEQSTAVCVCDNMLRNYRKTVLALTID